MIDLVKQFKVYNTELNLTDGALSEKDFYNTKFMQNDMLTNTMTYMFGNQWSDEFLLDTLTIGNAFRKGAPMGRPVPVTTTAYNYPVMGLFTKTDYIAEDPDSTNTVKGQYGQPFFLYFATNFFKKGYTIESPLEFKCRIVEEPFFTGTSWRYKVMLHPKAGYSFLPNSECSNNAQWSEFYAIGSLEEGQFPGEGNRILPGLATNQVSILRGKRSWKGNTANMQFKGIRVPDGTPEGTEYLLKQDDWWFEYRWRRAKDTLGWYGEYNKDANGNIGLQEYNPMGNTGDSIPEGGGILEQIPNVFEYSELSYGLIKNAIMSIFFSNPETMGKKITLITGQGGIEEFDRAMKEHITDQYAGSFWRSNDLVVQGQKDKLEVGAYVQRVYWLGGYSVEVIHNKSFDVGMRAVKSPSHPSNSIYPLESYRMVFLDTDNFGAEENLQYVYLKDWEMFDTNKPGVMPNLPNVPSFNYNFTTTESTKNEILRIGSCGYTLRKPNTSIQFICNAS